MQIADHIKNSIDAAMRRDLDSAMLFACLAVDGTSKKLYSDVQSSGKRFRNFIADNIDIIELMFGGINFEETFFPFKDNKGRIGLKFEDVIYEKFRCTLAHGDVYEPGYGITFKIIDGHHAFMIDTKNGFMTIPESCIYALGLPCVLSHVNADQKINNTSYFYKDNTNSFVIDRWWGKLDCARQIMDIDNRPRVKIDFSNVWPNLTPNKRAQETP